MSETSKTDQRRDFLKGAAAAAGAAAAIGVSQSSQAKTVDLDAFYPYGEPAVALHPRKATLRVSVDGRKPVNIKDLQIALESVLDRTGCPTCGLVGLDIRLGLDEIIDVGGEAAAVATIEGGSTSF